MACYQVDIVSKELQEIVWRTDVFPHIIAVLTIQAGFLVHTRQSLKVWPPVESVFPPHTAVVITLTISEEGTVVHISYTIYQGRITLLGIAVTEAQVSVSGCFEFSPSTPKLSRYKRI